MVKRLDYHMHTKLCGHAVGEMFEYVEAAIANNLDEIGFSDHMPMVYLPSYLPLDEYCMSVEELPLYVQAVKQLQEDYPNLVIKLGIEADYYEGKDQEIKNLINQAEFDYVLGSVHALGDPAFVVDDERFSDKHQQYEIFELYQMYFSNLKKAVETGLFDVMAHLDLPKKFGDRPKESIQPMVDVVIDALVQTKTAIEVNTGGYRKPVAEQYPSEEILRACCENDIQVTIGSDSHRPDEVGWEVDRALTLLRKVGYNQIIGFKKRKRIFFEI